MPNLNMRCDLELKSCNYFFAFFKASSSRTLNVEQVKIVDEDGNLKVVYPSKTDLVFSDKRIAVKRP